MCNHLVIILKKIADSIFRAIVYHKITTMNRFITIFFCIFFSLRSFSQTAPAIQWQNAIGGKHAGIVTKMVPTRDGGYIVVGWVDSTNNLGVTNYHKNNDAWVAKLDATCNIEWQQCYGGSDNDWAYCAEQTKDGGYIIGGITGSIDGDVKINKGGADIWIFKLDESGKFIWQKTLGGSGFEMINNLHQTKDGGYIIAARTNSRNGDVVGHHNIGGLYIDYDGWVVKIDSVGNKEWQKCLGGSDDDSMEDILETDDGGYISTGYTLSNDGDINYNHGYGDGWIIKLNSLGKIKWQKCYGGTDADGFSKILKTKDKGFILGGGTSSNDGDVNGFKGGGDMWLVKIDSIGDLEWQRCYGGSKQESFGSLQSTKDNGFVFCGGTLSDDGDVSGYHGWHDYWVVKTDSLGNIQWQRCLGGKNADQAYDLYVTTDYGYIISGQSGSLVGDGDITIRYDINDSTLNLDNWIVKLSIEPNAIKANSNANQLLVYPNPAHDFIGIDVSNIKEIRILDVLGRLYMHKQINTAANIYTYMNIQYLTKGVYIVQAIGIDGSIKVAELMVE